MSAGLDEQPTTPERFDGPHRTKIVADQGAFYDMDAVLTAFADRVDISYADLSNAASANSATQGAAGVIVVNRPVTAEIINALDAGVRVIGRTGVGVDLIDLDAARRRGITVFNQPSYGATDVACQAVAMTLALHRRLLLFDDIVRGVLPDAPPPAPQRPLDELTLGLIGCGRIGSEVARMLAPMVANILVYDPYAATLPPAVEPVPEIAHLLRRSNVISLHLPATAATRHLLGASAFALMPEGALFINVARGALVDERALADALSSGHLGGAGLDVFDTEPLPADSPLRTAPNTILSPHVASYTRRGEWRLAHWTVEDAVSFVTTGVLLHGSVVV